MPCMLSNHFRRFEGQLGRPVHVPYGMHNHQQSLSWWLLKLDTATPLGGSWHPDFVELLEAYVGRRDLDHNCRCAMHANHILLAVLITQADQALLELEVLLHLQGSCISFTTKEEHVE